MKKIVEPPQTSNHTAEQNNNSQELNGGALSSKSQVIFLIIARIIPNCSVRIIYPFLSVFALGLGVGLPAISMAVSSRSFLGIASPLLGSWIDRAGRKAGMLLGLALLVLSSVLVILFPTYPVFYLFICISYVGLLSFASSMQSYIGDEVPYAQRGRVMSLVETSWALSLIVCMPLMAVLMARWGWQAPFPLLAGLAAIVFFVLRRYLPETHRPSSVSTKNVLAKVREILQIPSARMALFFMAALSAANECVGLVYGVWIADSLGSWDETLAIPLLALGAASIVIGLAELSGELIGGGLIDRLGKERSVFIGILCHAAFSLLLPVFGKSLWGAYFGLFMLYLGAEFTVVASLTLMTELVPDLRSTMMGANMAFISFGRMLGALLVPVLYERGFHFNALAAFIISIIALFLVNRLRTIARQAQAA